MNYNKIKNEPFSFVYITSEDCNVCKILQPKLRKLAKKYESTNFHSISLDENKDASGYFMAFTIPTFIVYSEGKEIVRYSRNLSVNEIENKLDRIYKMLT